MLIIDTCDTASVTNLMVQFYFLTSICCNGRIESGQIMFSVVRA